MNLSEEVRDGYTVSAQMKQVWEIQLRIVRKVLEVCQKHEIPIWADGGTLLGAVRHKGYIPWDDDIDLFMTRENYDRLLKVAPTEFKSPFFFQCAYTDKLYCRGHAQVRYEGTTALVKNDVDRKFHCGIFIDIFIYDALPADKEEFVRRIIRAERLRKLMRERVVGKFCLSDPKGSLFFLYSLLYFAIHPFRKVFAQFESIYAARDCARSSDYSCPAFTVAQTFKIVRKAEWLADTVWLPFEDISLPAPIGYDAVLRNQYGDYMTPVKAPSLHGGIYFDTKRDYRDVIRDVKNGKLKID